MPEQPGENGDTGHTAEEQLHDHSAASRVDVGVCRLGADYENPYRAKDAKSDGHIPTSVYTRHFRAGPRSAPSGHYPTVDLRDGGSYDASNEVEQLRDVLGSCQ